MDFDKNKAKELVGKYILIGITYLDNNGEVETLQQLHGTIKSATKEGILIDIAGVYQGEEWNMPPYVENITEANPGNYNLKSTGETVENPDLLCTWEVHRSKDDE